MKHPELPERWQWVDRALDYDALEGIGPAGRTVRVMWSDGTEVDGRRWRHVSIGVPPAFGRRPDLPTWTEVEWARRWFIGEDHEAYQVHPPADSYVSFAEVLHLWACLEVPNGRILPDFTKGTGTI